MELRGIAPQLHIVFAKPAASVLRQKSLPIIAWQHLVGSRGAPRPPVPGYWPVPVAFSAIIAENDTVTRR